MWSSLGAYNLIAKKTSINPWTDRFIALLCCVFFLVCSLGGNSASEHGWTYWTTIKERWLLLQAVSPARTVHLGNQGLFTFCLNTLSYSPALKPSRSPLQLLCFTGNDCYDYDLPERDIVHRVYFPVIIRPITRFNENGVYNMFCSLRKSWAKIVEFSLDISYQNAWNNWAF